MKDTAIPERPALERRILASLDASRIPVLLGGCGSGRTSLLQRVGNIIGPTRSHYVDIERAASTPEGFAAAVMEQSPYAPPGDAEAPSTGGHNARAALDGLLHFLCEARAEDGGGAVFLIDEVLELRSFESFPGLRGVLRELIDTLAASPNRFVVTTRYVSRAHRLLRDAPDRFEVIHVPPLSPSELATALLALNVGGDDAERADLSRMIHALTDGRPTYVRTLAQAISAMEGASSGDPVSALAAELAVGAHLCLVCRFSYELRLHRARGYGALKAILLVLAEEEPLALTEIAHRLGRTPGSTKDYLTWLEDVDLVSVRHKRYSFGDPLLRLWVRLHCRPTPPGESDLAREVQEYAVSRLPYIDAVVVTRPPERETETETKEKAWSIIEID